MAIEAAAMAGDGDEWTARSIVAAPNLECHNICAEQTEKKSRVFTNSHPQLWLIAQLIARQKPDHCCGLIESELDLSR